MVAYSSNELISSSQFAKQFGNYLSQIKNRAVEKLAILKNNKVEAILISKDEYEKMVERIEYLENQELLNISKQRLSKPYKTLSHQEMLEKLDISGEDLK